MNETRDLKPNQDRMLRIPLPEKLPLYDVVCLKCQHHQVTERPPTSCVKCSSLLIEVTRQNRVAD